MENQKCANLKCGCEKNKHELYQFADGTKERIGCLDCGELICNKFQEIK